MVEFALALPILLLVMYGLIESGRLLFIYASVVSASRQAVRYGSVTGDNGSGTPYFNDCAGIRASAQRLAFLQPIQDSDILISYDNGPTPTWTAASCPITAANHPANGDRIRVQVSAQFTPIVPLVPFRPFVITSTGVRTLLIGVSVAVTAPGVVLTPGSNGAMTIFKQASPGSFDNPGVTITYSYLVTNIGSDPLTNVSVTDDKAGAASCPSGASSIAGGSSVTCTATYVTTAGDVAAGSLTNVATANATSLGVPIVAQTSLTINFVAKPKLALTKDGVAPIVIAAGNLVSYTFTLQNTGNVPLTAPYTISDPLVGGSWDCPPSTMPSPLPVGASGTCTGSYPLTQNDINKGTVTNTATASAMYKTFTTTSNPASWTVNVPPLVLTLDATPLTVSALGQTITYTYTVRNRTVKVMTDITVTDTRGAIKYTCPAWTQVNPGTTATCTRTYNAYTQADMDAGLILNQAQALAKGSYSSNQASVTVTVTQNIKLTLTKTGSVSQATSLPATISYTYALKNDGNVTLKSPFVVNDDKIAGINCSGAPNTMAPGAPVYTCPSVSYGVTPADLLNGSIINHATATAALVSGTATSNQATWTVITYLGARLGITKSADPANFTGAGQTITYTYTLKNTGGVPINGPYTVVDDKIGTIDCSAALSPLPIGGTTTCAPGTYVTTTGDLTSVTNNVTATASGGLSATTSLTVNKFLCDSTHLKHLQPTPIPSGSDVLWTIVNNTGLSVQVASITVSWGTVPPALSQVLLGSTPIGGGYPSVLNGGYVLPGSPWTLATGNTVLELKFSGIAANIRVILTFTDPRCPAVDSSVVYPD